MPRPRNQALFGRRFLRHLSRLIGVYWRSPDGRWGALLLAGAIVLELGTVYANLHLSDAERRIMDAIQDKQPTTFLTALGIFAAISALFVFVSTYRLYMRQLVEIRWRRGVTAHYLERWMSERAYAQVQLHGEQVDNPDQRVAEDVRDFVASALGLSLSLLAALATLVSFGILLWRLSAHWPVTVGARHFHVPGFLLWVALLYTALSTWLTHLVGRKLVPINFDRLRYEADFRYGLMRFRDNVEVVTLSRGEAVERRSALERFQNVIRNWSRLIVAQRRLGVFVGVVGQANGVVPLLVAAPSFFAGLITLGTVAQIRFAYGQVSAALTWFVSAYQEIARWRANVERLSTFTEMMDMTAQELERSRVQVVPGRPRALQLCDVRLATPSGAPLIDAANATVTTGDRVAIAGPSGVGKTVLLRAIAGMWPFGTGRIEVPPEANMLFVPQWPYLPHGTLRAVVAYPAEATAFTDESTREVLRLLGLGHLTSRLDETAPWDQQLTPHEQQRVTMARVLLNRPDWIFLDKATSALDEDTERHVYELLAERLPDATVISIALGPRVVAYHSRRWTVVGNEHGPSSLDAA